MWYHLQTKTSNRARKWHFAMACGDKEHLDGIAADWQKSGIICRVVTQDEANA